MGEWLKPPVLKTGNRKVRGFESHSLRHDVAVRVEQTLGDALLRLVLRDSDPKGRRFAPLVNGLESP